MDENIIETFPIENKQYISQLPEDKREEYMNLSILYRKMLNEYFKAKALENYDSEISNSDLGFISVPIDKKDFYQVYSPLNYFYVRNNVYIERLSDSELDYLRSCHEIDESCFGFIEKTFGDVTEERREGLYDFNTNYGPDTSSYFLASNTALVIGFRYDEYNLNGMSDQQWDSQNDLQNQFLEEIISKLEAELKQSFGNTSRVIMYNDFSVKPIDQNLRTKQM